MNYRIIARITGRTLILVSCFQLFPLIVALIYREPILPFLITAAFMLIVGIPFSLIKTKNSRFLSREGFASVTIIWILVSICAALPFWTSGFFKSFIDCVFESVSGFTTTGSTILTEVESLPKSILFWRSMTHWLGGMGVLILALAVLPNTGERTIYLMKAESTGPSPEKLVPKIAQSTKISYAIYICLSILQVIALLLAGMDVFDAITHTFSTAGTGGFSTRNLSIGAYNSTAIEMIISVFMLLFSINFSVYFFLITGRIKSILKNDELRFFLCLVGISTVLIAVNLIAHFGNVFESLREAFFNVSSVISTTGFVTVDFDQWPGFSKLILLLLMVVGACTGSTAGGIKVSRLLLLLKSIKVQLLQILHPRAVHTIRMDGVAVSEETLKSVMQFFVAYCFIFFISCLIVSLDNLGLTATVTSVLTCFGNVGPGLGLVGPMGNFSSLSGLSKGVLSLVMIIGRLEIFPILIFFSPAFWKKS